MNDTQFENSLRNAFPVPQSSDRLDAKIDQALLGQRPVSFVGRRIALSFALTSAIGVGLVVVPTVRAQAVVGRIAQALDKAVRLRMSTYTIDEAGHRWLSSTTTIANGDRLYAAGAGTRFDYGYGDKSYSFDPALKVYIVRPRWPEGSLKVSKMSYEVDGFQTGKRPDIQKVVWQGREVLQVIIPNRDLPERTVIEADPKSELPIAMQTEARESGGWRVRQVHEFDYNVPDAVVKPDFERFTVLTPAEADARRDAELRKSKLGLATFSDTRLIVRNVDVAKDGTVFVAYQSGNRRPRSWSGYAVNVSDNLGTKYVRVGELMDDMEGPFNDPDGRVEMEVFVPSRPINPTQSRTVTLTTQRYDDGRLAKMNWMPVPPTNPAGELKWHAMEYRHDEKPVVPIGLFSRPFASPSCDESPAWAGKLNRWLFGNEFAIEELKAQRRAKQAMEDENWPYAEAQLQEQLRQQQDSERHGYSSYVRTEALENLEKVREKMAKP